MTITLRPARPTAAEARRLLAWENGSRESSWQRAPISWAEHWTWYQDRVAGRSPQHLLMAEWAGALVGSLTLTPTAVPTTVQLGLIIAPPLRGLGLGTATIEAATAYARDTLGAQRVVAEIKAGNVASLRAFRKAHFTDELVSDPVRGGFVYHCVRETA